MIDPIHRIDTSKFNHKLLLNRFGDALSLMTPNSIVYGGAIRDYLANKEIRGDLDIALPQTDSEILCKRFEYNPRWKLSWQVGQDLDAADLDVPGIIKRVTEFVSSSNKNVKVQLIVTNEKNYDDSTPGTIYLAKMVDIVCCGVVMFFNSDIFEVIGGAYEDCKRGILRLNEKSKLINESTLEKRINKLVKRGWKNTIDIEKALKNKNTFELENPYVVQQ